MTGGKSMKDLIDRQQAIDGADAIIARDTSGNNDVVKAMTAWKSYVEALPSAQPLVIHCTDCEDWLERQSILGVTISELPSAQPEIVLELLKTQPTIEPRKGKWKEHKDYPGLAYLCSECGYFTTMRTNFCPNCGADMREVRTE
jgi:hypothetical protein